MAPSKEELSACQEHLRGLIAENMCAPILVRLAWHDSGTFDKDGGSFPDCGGANGSIRFEPEINHGGNAGLRNALALLDPVKEKYPTIGWADLMQMASAVAIEVCGGPKIPMKYGRVDATGPEMCPKEGNLPDGNAPFGDGSANASEHVHRVYSRMGFNSQEAVALSGAHTIGRAQPDRSGACKMNSTKYTAGAGICPHAIQTKAGQCGKQGGQSWTAQWLKFDNSYFQHLVAEAKDPELLILETDGILATDPDFKATCEKYAADQAAFFADYAAAHAKLSELGSKFEPAGGITI